jgi:hypothetical protein
LGRRKSVIFAVFLVIYKVYVMNRFPSSLDDLSKIITACILLLGLVLPCLGYYIYCYDTPGYEPIALAVIGLSSTILFALFISMYIVMPVAIVVGGEGIAIERRSAKPITIKYAEIKGARLVEEGEMKGTIRTFGNGGICGYTGAYYNRKLGSMRLYCTQRANFVVIDKANDRRYILSPDDPMGLVAAISKRLPQC